MKKIIASLALAVLSTCAFAQADEGASLLGVPVMSAHEKDMQRAIKRSGGKQPGISNSNRNEFVFPPDTFPSGIRKVNFFYNKAGFMAVAEAHIPGTKAFERKKEQAGRYETLINGLKQRYGEPRQIKSVKNEFGSYPQYEWVFNDGSAISLLDRGPIYGMKLQYINVPVMKSYVAESSSIRSGNL